ncbi:MAG: alpha/beta hydrolase [Eubacteriales bacterium]|nr:alpha/beta hydrolase [Eubacteriales bacterium]
MENIKAEEIKIDIDGTYMNVIRFGNGNENLIIISGLTVTGLEGQGEAVANAYSALSRDYRICLFERKKDIPENYSHEDMAEDVFRCSQLIGIESAFVYGVSQGGMIGELLALSHPDFVKKLILCSSSCRITEKLEKASNEWRMYAQEKDIVALNRSFFKYVYSPAFLESVKEMLPALEMVGSARDCERFLRLLEPVSDFDISGELNKIKCPVLVIGDANDAVIGPEGSYQMAEILKCDLHMYDCYSHAVYDEAPDIKEVIAGFLKRPD